MENRKYNKKIRMIPREKISGIKKLDELSGDLHEMLNMEDFRVYRDKTGHYLEFSEEKPNIDAIKVVLEINNMKPLSTLYSQ